MRALKCIIAAAVVAVAMLAGAPSAQAQFRFGPKVGLNVNKLHFNGSTIDSDNRAGFTAGLMAEFTAPIIGVGMDASVMYVRRSARWAQAQQIDKRDYIEIPLNLKWKMNIPVINAVARPYLTTGPSFAFLTSRKSFQEFRNKKTDVAWNFGFGVELLRHLQVGASYGLGLTKALEEVNAINGAAGIEGKNRYWTVTAAYLF